MTSNLVRGGKDVALNSIKRFWFNGILKVIVLLYVLWYLLAQLMYHRLSFRCVALLCCNNTNEQITVEQNVMK